MFPSFFVTTLANPTLLPEILDQIFGFLHPEIDGLKACSEALSTTSLRGLSDSWLYRDVCVYTGSLEFGGKGTDVLYLHSSELSQLLQSKTKGALLDVNQYIHSICITLRSSAEGAEIAPLLSNPLLMPRLRALTLRAAKGRMILWERCDPDFRKSLLNRLAWTGDGDDSGRESGVIKELAVRTTEGFPIRVLERCTGLKKVYLNAEFDFGLRPYESFDANFDVAQPCLYHLSVLRMPVRVMDWLTRPNTVPMISNLRFLNLGQLDVLAWGAFSFLLEMCKDTLEEIAVDLRSQSFFVWTDVGITTDPTFPLELPPEPSLTQNYPALCKLTVLAGIASTAHHFVSGPTMPELHLRRRYGTSLKKVGNLCQQLGCNPAFSDHLLLKEIDLKVEFDQGGVDPPSLAEIDFQPLFNSFPPSNSSTNQITSTSSFDPSNLPVINLDIISAKRDAFRISFSSLLADIEKNEGLSRMVADGKVTIVKR